MSNEKLNETTELRGAQRLGQSALTCLLCDAKWVETSHCDGDDKLHSVNIVDVGRITVLDRMSGFGNGIRDIESGYRDTDNKFWLASGQCDVRLNKEITIESAIAWIKENANTCVGA